MRKLILQGWRHHCFRLRLEIAEQDADALLEEALRAAFSVLSRPKTQNLRVLKDQDATTSKGSQSGTMDDTDMWGARTTSNRMGHREWDSPSSPTKAMLLQTDSRPFVRENISQASDLVAPHVTQA